MLEFDTEEQAKAEVEQLILCNKPEFFYPLPITACRKDRVCIGKPYYRKQECGYVKPARWVIYAEDWYWYRDNGMFTEHNISMG